MKKQILLKKIAVLALLSVFGVGCAKESSGGSDGGGGVTPTTQCIGSGCTSPTTPNRDTDAERGTEWQQGAIANLTLDSNDALQYYAITHPINAPTDVKISVKLFDAGSNQYAGRVMISYFDNNQYFTGRFITENRTVSSGTSHGHDGKNHAAYNKFFQWGPQQVFHGFYKDQYGAIMIIIDQELNSGDGGGASEVGGSIWFKNYAITNAPYSGLPCWFVELGPYDCRTFLKNNEDLVTTSALYPSQSMFFTSWNTNPYIPQEPARGWRRLGTFNGLNKAKAFSQ